MKPDIHPKYKEVKVTCSCGNAFVTSSTLEKDDLHLEVCSNCHPFYTGKQRLVDNAGRVDRFRKKYSDESLAQKQAAIKTPEVQAEPAKKTSKAKKPAAKTATKKAVKE